MRRPRPNNNVPVRVVTLGDAAVLIELGAIIDERLNEAAVAAADQVRGCAIPGIRDIVPAYASFAVYIDPARTDVQTVVDLILASLNTMTDAPVARIEHPPIEIPVCYDPAFAPDLPAVAIHAGCSEDDAVAIHASRTYRVFMLGFLPGFPYMGIVDDRIAVPRHETPRIRVAAGSVGIAGRQTGIYPRDTPGGWQIIGRTPLRLFDVRRDPPTVLTAGMSVRFVPITRTDFDDRSSRKASA
jgi:inhibitor of KinA